MQLWPMAGWKGGTVLDSTKCEALLPRRSRLVATEV
jgi:hypothetical protein